MQPGLKTSTTIFLAKLAALLGAGIVLCTAMHLLVHTLPNGENNRWLISMFDLDSEKNVPTWYASILWFLVSLSATCAYFAETWLPSLLANGQRNTPNKPGFPAGWLVIAAIFLVASADEVATIHEEVGSHLQTWHSSTSMGQVIAIGQHAQSSPNSPWIVFYAPILAVIGLGIATFLCKRLWQYRTLVIFCILCIDCFVAAIAADHYQGMLWDQRQSLAQSIGMDTVMATNLSVTIEETLENLGCVFLILAFSGYAWERGCAVREEQPEEFIRIEDTGK